MTSFEIYTFILCLIVFVLLTALAIFTISVICKLTLKLIKSGVEDEDIIAEFSKEKKESKIGKAIDFCVLLVLCSIVIFLFSSSLYVNCTQNTYFENIPTYKVVKTDSMSKKNEKNEYLFDNNLNDQFQAFDLIATHKLPAEEDLQLYDIVVYEVDDMLIVHRIVEIEEPNERHPNERHFKLQGDAIASPDRFPVLYSQMRGIYTGERIPFVGSFILFMQSPAGWLCILLVVGAMIATPILEKMLFNARKARYLLIVGAEETAATEISEEETASTDEFVDSRFANFKPSKTFYEKLKIATDEIKNRHNSIKQLLLRFEGIRTIEGKTQHSYKRKSICIARLFFRGKTLHLCLGLNPNDYENSKYVYTDLSETIKHKSYPMCLKLTSERQTRWARELILELAKNKGLTVLDELAKDAEDVSAFTQLKGKRVRKTFKQKLKLSPLAKERFSILRNYLKAIDGIRVIESKYGVTYKLGNKPVVKFLIRGKTLNAYLGLNPNEYQNTKYIFTDASNAKKYTNYPMRVKVSSVRQVKWVQELIQKAIKP